MNEAVRVKAVKQFKDLDLQLDSELQELITMASEICDTPIALITLLDDDTQWLTVRRGVDLESSPRNISFCHYAIQQDDDLMIVKDALDDERFASFPFVADEPNIRFYAGAPLITHDGLKLGTLCVVDNKPRELDKHQQLMLKMLSRQAISLMELKLNYAQLEQSKREAEEQRKIIINAEIRLRAFFESSANLHVLLGKAGEVLDYNKTAYNFIKKVHETKLTRGDLFITYLAPAFVTTFIEKFKKAMAGEKCYAEGSTDYRPNGQIWWEAGFEPAWNNQDEIIGVSYSVRNVTERKLYEQKIVSQNQSLISIAYIQSHEYRGPLSSIMGMMNLIREEDYHPPVEYLELLEIAINKLDEKIQDIVTQVNNHDVNNTVSAEFF